MIARSGLFVLFLIFAGAPVSAQAQTGSVQGTIKDSTDAVVPNAEASLKTSDGVIVKSTVSDATGAYALLGLPTGSYTLLVSARGFKPFVRAGVSVTDSTTTTIDVPLDVAQSVSSVEVNAKADPFQVVPDVPTKSVFGLDLPVEETPRSSPL